MTRKTGPASITSRWEWVAGALSTLAVLGLVGVLLHGALQPRTAPDLRVRGDSVRPAGTGYRVSFTVENRGGTSVEGVHIEGTLSGGTTPVESRTVTLEHLPAGGRRTGVIQFVRDPAQHTLQLVPVGYREP